MKSGDWMDIFGQGYLISTGRSTVNTKKCPTPNTGGVPNKEK